MGLVVRIRWASFTAGTEIGIVADSTLVSITLDISLNPVIVVAKRTIAVDAMVTSLAVVSARYGSDIVERLVDRDEAVAWVDKVGIWNADGAKVPIWAVEALMPDTIDVLITSVADSIVPSVATRGE